MAKLSAAVRAIERAGILLVYPIANRPEPRSLWSALFPRQQMNWSWDEGADAEVGELWRLRAELAKAGEVVYAKWYQGRATFFSKRVFTAMLGRIRRAAPDGDVLAGLGRNERELLELLEENSPLSTKELRGAALEGGRFARRSDVDRAMRQLWERLLVLGVGEVDDGAFPSLSVGATSLVFEPLWEASRAVLPADDQALTAALDQAPAFARQFAKVLGRVAFAGSEDPGVPAADARPVRGVALGVQGHEQRRDGQKRDRRHQQP